MTAWLGSLFGTEKAVDNLLNKDTGHLAKLGGWFGKLNFTTEEQAVHNKEMANIGIERLKALAPFKVMQRIMVTIIMVEWAILFNCAVFCVMMEWDARFDKLMIFAQSEFAWMPVSAAVLCYLLGGVVPSRGK